MIGSPEHLYVLFEQAFNRHDLEAIVALYEPGAVLVTVNGPAQGSAAIREAYRVFLASHPTIELQTLGVTSLGEAP
jgi:ketosteroid isomerase-like protein